MSKRKIARPEAGTLAKFSPEGAHIRAAQADAVIEYAKRIRDWPLLEQAIDHKLEEQTAFLAWWQATVTPRRRLSPGRPSGRTNNGQ